VRSGLVSHWYWRIHSHTLMETDTTFVIVQLLVALSLIAGLLSWVLRGLMCSVLGDAGGRVVLVTGCDTGIGHEVARHLDAIGFTVFAGCLDTASEGAQRLRVEASPSLRLVNMDVRREEHVRVALQFVEDNLPAGEAGLYAVVNNAGVCVCGEFDWQTWGQVQSQVETNLLGTLRVTKLSLPLLKQCLTGGRVINVSSVGGLYGYPGLSIYCATKHAIEGFSQVLRLELSKFGVEVVTLQPGDFSKATHLLDSHHTNMNQMWGEMCEQSREEYKQFFLAYHDRVARSGFTGHRFKPQSVLPQSMLRGFEQALLAKVPERRYLLLPSWQNWIKMVLLGLIPTEWAQQILARRYRKSTPLVNTRNETSFNTITY